MKKSDLIELAKKDGHECQAACEHMLGAGVPAGVLAGGRKLGLTFSQILALVIQYGPKVISILEELAKLIPAKEPAAEPATA